MSHRRYIRNLCLGAALGSVIALAPSVALAHVHVDTPSPEAGSNSLLTFSATHGCEGSPTTQFTISMPEDILTVNPTPAAGWNLEMVTDGADDSHPRVTEVVYTAQEPVPDRARLVFDVNVRLPEEAVEQTLYFPTVQTCSEGETAWVEIPDEGQNSHDLQAPAPAVKVVKATGETGHGGDQQAEAAATGGGTEMGGAVSRQNIEVADEGTPVMSVVALILGALGLIAGGLALARTGGSSRS